MREFLDALRDGQLVVDLGCRGGSFDAAATAATVVGVDLAAPTGISRNFVRADAANLPFAADSVDLVIANHSLEHFEDLDGAVREIGRIVKSGGALFVSVPDASTVTDRIYRWLGKGGGHVNAIVDPIEFADYIQARTRLPWQATRVLYSGLSFLNRKNCARRQRKLWLVGGGFEFTLQAATYGFRLLDRIFGTRLSIYGWAFCFGGLPFPLEEAWTNVCVRCGAGAGSVWLENSGAVQKLLLVPYYRCSACDALNLFTHDSSEGWPGR